MGRLNGKPINPSTTRVAIYTRKSTAEGLTGEFSSLDAQRQAVEAYVASQRGEGWVALPERYDDGGFTGANTDRPAFRRLIQDIDSGKVDSVAVYKIDRLSRSLNDFVQIMRVFGHHGVTFVSVTQQFSTTTSMGKLTLNLLMSFAEFERELIAERTRDKVSAARKKGLWTGGHAVLGYDSRDKKLVVNAEEAKIVRTAFKLYLAGGSILSVAEEFNRRGWRTKSRKRNGKLIRGKAFGKAAIRRILTNSIYLGKVRYGGDIHEGAHEAIVAEMTWNSVAHKIKANRRHCGGPLGNTAGALLLGLLRCGVCGAPMTTHSARRGNRQFRYYVCSTYQKRGAAACPGSRAAVAELEAFVVEQVRNVGNNPGLLKKTIDAQRRELKTRSPELLAELKELGEREGDLHDKRRNVLEAIAKIGSGSGGVFKKLLEIESELECISARIEVTQSEIAALAEEVIGERDLKEAIATFNPVWEELFPEERLRILRLLIEELTYNAPKSELRITFNAWGVRELSVEGQRKGAL